MREAHPAETRQEDAFSQFIQNAASAGRRVIPNSSRNICAEEACPWC